MKLFLEIAGSIASLVGIPLAWYFYLRTRRSAHERARAQISHTLSYQLGEGRELSVFEVMAVIESVTREARIPSDKINFEEVVDDLVTETIRNPMLEGNRKAGIVKNLRDIHGTSQSWQIVSKYGLPLTDLLTLAQQQGRQMDSRDLQVLDVAANLQPAVEVGRRSPDLVALFGAFSLLLGFVGLVLSMGFPESSISRLFLWPFRPRTLIANLMQGLAITAGAWLMAKGTDYFLNRGTRYRARKSKREP
jgi:hypothetical protein